MDNPVTPWQRIGDEITRVLARVDPADMAAAATFLDERPGRWFVTGQGRSGLVGRMSAMRLMHLGRPTHVVGETTAPAIGPGDHLVALSSSGRTPVTLHLARLAVDVGVDLLAVTAEPGSEITQLAGTTLVVPAGDSTQFGGSLFEQCALVLLDAVVLQLSADDADAYRQMGQRHANLQ